MWWVTVYTKVNVSLCGWSICPVYTAFLDLQFFSTFYKIYVEFKVACQNYCQSVYGKVLKKSRWNPVDFSVFTWMIKCSPHPVSLAKAEGKKALCGRVQSRSWCHHVELAVGQMAPAHAFGTGGTVSRSSALSVRGQKDTTTMLSFVSHFQWRGMKWIPPFSWWLSRDVLAGSNEVIVTDE